METLAPLINLLVLMSVLSIASERLANAIKLRDPELREKKNRTLEEKERERRIAHRALAASILLAVLVKADFFAILAHLEAPWDTLGWARPVSVSAFLYTIFGTLLTGFSLGFGSKFWHDVLDLVHGVRDAIRG